jgi:hypothetical protein
MRLAYIILSHRLPRQLVRLIRVLGDADDVFFVHLDKRAGRQVNEELSREVLRYPGIVGRVRLVKRHRCYWGAFGIVKATIEAINALVHSGVGYDRAILISGEDYPIKPRSYIKAFLQNHPDEEFMESFALTSKNKWSEYAGAYHALARVLHWHLRFRSRTLHIPVVRRFPDGMRPHGGSQWWCLSRACIEYICHFIQNHPTFVNYFKHAFIADELFFQTIVANSPFAEKLSGHDLTYTDWDQPQPPYPATLGKQDLPKLIASPQLFARKFNSRADPEILDLVDQQILARSGVSDEFEGVDGAANRGRVRESEAQRPRDLANPEQGR